MTVVEKRPLFTTTEVARLLGVSVSAIYKAERERRIPPVLREEGSKDRVFSAEDLTDPRANAARHAP